MPYTPFDNAKPDGATQNGTAFSGSTKENQDALRDAVIAGTIVGWDLTVTAGSGTPENPQFFVYDEGVYRIRLTFTWNAAGDPATCLFEFSSNSGSSYDSMGTATYNYDGNENLTGVTWS